MTIPIQNTVHNIAQNIAMWSGPRNISTALMYSFASRKDCIAWDEPFYAWYLATTGLDHPMGAEVIASGETNAQHVIIKCVQDHGKLHYQKHMTQHMIDCLDRQWINRLNNAFLIRSPQKVLASYAIKRADVTLDDIGFVQQLEIFKQVADHTGKAPPVIDSDQFLAAPEQQLRALCSALSIDFTTDMLSWPKGPKPCDGIWASHWYNAAHQSTRFGKPTPKPINLSPTLQKIANQAQPIYDELVQYAI